MYNVVQVYRISCYPIFLRLSTPFAFSFTPIPVSSNLIYAPIPDNDDRPTPDYYPRSHAIIITTCHLQRYQLYYYYYCILIYISTLIIFYYFYDTELFNEN